MGEHGLMGKNMIYETAHRVPFLIRWPEKIARGLVVDRVVASVDFQQTLLGLVGLDACGREQGRDGSALLRGEDVAWEDVALIDHPSHKWAGVFTPEFEYAVHESGYGMLFDRVEDPDQRVNVYADRRDTTGSRLSEVVRALMRSEHPQAGWWN
jgi:arylsulfatase A-like enzyme